VVRGADVKGTIHPLTIVFFVVSIEEQSLGIARLENTKDFLKIIM
tara:strand:- start:613 stop:747 length:135 start_codon:yes stop_codon:yes gene_type:complete